MPELENVAEGPAAAANVGNVTAVPGLTSCWFGAAVPGLSQLLEQLEE